MSREAAASRLRLQARLRLLLWGSDDPRLRASWRVLLTWGLLLGWSVIAARVAALTRPYWNTAPGPAQQLLNIGVGTAVFLVLFAGFARYIDRRPLADYGFTRSPVWVAELAIGFLAVLLGTTLWHALGVVLGWTTVELALAPSNPTTILWLLVLLVPWYLSGLTQSLLSVTLVTKNAAEGLHARGAARRYAVAGAVLVAITFFTLRHSPTSATRVLSLVFGGGVFTLLYVHSGDLALSIGALGSANYTNQFIFSSAGGQAGGVQVFQLSQSFPQVVDVIAGTNLPSLLLAYLVAVGWLTWQRDGLAVHPSLTQWRPREVTHQDESP